MKAASGGGGKDKKGQGEGRSFPGIYPQLTVGTAIHCIGFKSLLGLLAERKIPIKCALLRLCAHCQEH